MAKGKEKKVSGELNAEEIENVAGGWCITGGISAPKEVLSIEKKPSSGDGYVIIISFSDGTKTYSKFNSDGELGTVITPPNNKIRY